MSFWKSLFKKSKKISSQEVESPVPSNFREYIKSAIILMGNKGADMDNNALIDLLVHNHIPEKEAIEILIFLPIAFCRKLLPELNWPKQYIDFYSG